MTKLTFVIALCLSLTLSACYFDQRRGLEGRSSTPMSGSSTNHAAAGEASLSVTDMYHMDVNAGKVPLQPQSHASPAP